MHLRDWRVLVVLHGRGRGAERARAVEHRRVPEKGGERRVCAGREQ